MEKAAQEKDKKLKTQEEKIGNLQEENLQQLQQSQTDAATTKKNFDRDLAEL